jgi:hypothetical protein
MDRTLPAGLKMQKIKTPKQKVMKGRPITLEEFKRLLDATEKVVRADAAA